MFFELEWTGSCRDFQSIKAFNIDDSQPTIFSHPTNGNICNFYYSFILFSPRILSHIIQKP